MIHQTAVIDKSAVIGNNVKIGAYTIIGKDVVIGDETVIGSNAYIEYAELGKNCQIYTSVSIGTPPQDISYKNEPSKVYIGSNTVAREFVTINRGTKKTGKTVVGANCYFMACSHVAHDCIVGNGVIIANCSAAGGHVEIEDNVFVSGNVGIHQFTRLGKGSMTGANSMVGMDIVPYTICNGQRAVIEGLNIVGIRRLGISEEQIKIIKEAYKILFLSKLLLNDALVELEKLPSKEVKEIINFIKSTKRGIARPG